MMFRQPLLHGEQSLKAQEEAIMLGETTIADAAAYLKDAGDPVAK